jgi:integrase
MLNRSGLTNDEVDHLIGQSRKGDATSLVKALKCAEDKGIQRITRYTLRHFMATRVRGMTESNVGREQRSLWLGHGKRDATSWYETHDPEFLRECALATNLVIDKLNNLMKRDLVPPNVQHKRLLTGNHKKYGRVA